MGRYSEQLTAPLADLAGVRAGQRALDVGCGPGALTRELVARLGAEAVSAVEPSPSFVAAARERHPDVAIEQASAEELPFADASFDAALAQLVVHFMRDPVAGLREMARVTRPAARGPRGGPAAPAARRRRPGGGRRAGAGRRAPPRRPRRGPPRAWRAGRRRGGARRCSGPGAGRSRGSQEPFHFGERLSPA